MDVEDFICQHPVLWQMAGSWPKMQRHGLLSTTALLDLFCYTGEERRRIESERRTGTLEIMHQEHGTALIRDNYPLREQLFLAECLEDMTVREWYELLNRKTFFWVSKERLERLLSARAYRNRAHDIVTVDTRQLVERATLIASHSRRLTLVRRCTRQRRSAAVLLSSVYKTTILKP